MTTPKAALKPIIMVVGGQYGSEAKGAVAAALCLKKGVDYAVRTGGVNAGHTVYYGDKSYKMQQLPTGWVNPKTKLVIGPGAYINRQILQQELLMLGVAGRIMQENNDLLIDPRAGLHNSLHTDRSVMSGRHHSMGATGKGCSEAVVDRIMKRGTGAIPLYGGNGPDTEKLLNDAYDGGRQILLEGTQGQMLDILLGPWPYTTHKPTSPAQWLVETGLSPNLRLEIVMVARTYPIRVAGNSGPLPKEISWSDFAWAWPADKRPGGVTKDELLIWDQYCAMIGEDWAESGRLPKHTGPKYGGKPNYDFMYWSIEQRVEYAKGLSEFHAEVVRWIEHDHPEVMGRLKQLFEFTTVTKKLRRIAKWDMDAMRASVRQVRPSYVVLTFLDYEFPELAAATESKQLHKEAMEFIRGRERDLGVWVRYVTTGPKTENFIAVDEAE